MSDLVSGRSLGRALSELFEELDAGLLAMHEGVRSVELVDYADYTNVGDSAIQAGQLLFWRRHGIRIDALGTYFSTASTNWGNRSKEQHGIALTGGGHFGGLYPPFEERRLQLAVELDEAVPLIQFPQSVVFPSVADKEASVLAWTSRERNRIAVRDRNSHQVLATHGVSARLLPDCVHYLGRLAAAPPTEDVVLFARTDGESTASLSVSGFKSLPVLDWPAGGTVRRGQHYLKYEREWPKAISTLGRRPVGYWESHAWRRLEFGIKLLSPYRTIITDRLHAMLISLHMGRRVIAVDNANSKLSNYASTWLRDSAFPLDFADSFEDAIRIAQQR